MYCYQVFEENIKIDVTPPSSFNLVNPEDYVVMINESIKNGAPPMIINDLIYRYMTASNKADNVDSSLFNLVVDSDRLISERAESIVLGLSRGTVQPWEMVLHQSGMYIAYRLLNTVNGFLELPYEEKINQMQKFAKTLVQEPEFVLPAPQL